MQRGRHQSDVRNKLLKSALVLLRKGVDGVTTRATARLARVSHAAPANHFPDRSAMLTAVAVLCLAGMREAAGAAASQAGRKPRERLDAYLTACLEYGLRHPERYRLMWRTDLLDASDENLKLQSNGVLSDINELMLDLQPPAKGSRTTQVIAVCSMMHGYILMRIDGNFDSLSDETTGRPRYLAMIDALC